MGGFGSPAGKGDGERKKIKERKAAGTHLLGTGQEGGPGPGKSACLLSPVTQPPPSLLCSLCDTGLSPLVAAPNRRCSRCPADMETPPPRERRRASRLQGAPCQNGETSFQVSTLQIRKLNKSPGGQDCSQQGSVVSKHVGI